MLRLKLLQASLVAAVVTFSATDGYAQEFSARLIGFNETPLAILSDASGTFRLDLDKNAQTATYTLTYSSLSAPILFAHIHFGKVHVSGGIIVFLCGGGGKPACPQSAPASSPVTGTITGANVMGLANQGVTAGDFDALEDALTSNTAYANVHTTNFPSGEIRGQVRRVEREDQQD
jgi:hypothetical protein